MTNLTHNRLDVLINNAGCMVNTRTLVTVPDTDLELDTNFATNTLGTYLLTTGLVPLLARSGQIIPPCITILNTLPCGQVGAAARGDGQLGRDARAEAGHGGPAVHQGVFSIAAFIISCFDALQECSYWEKLSWDQFSRISFITFIRS